MPESKLIPGIAHLDGYPERQYPCMYIPTTKWNGWDIPYFTHDVGMSITADISGLKYHDDTNRFVDEEMEDEYGMTTFLGGKSFYAIGGFYWTWVCEPTLKEN